MADRPAAETGTKEISFKKPFRFTLAMVLLVMLLFAGLAVLCFSGGLLLKLGIILVMMWAAGPACSHLIAGMLAEKKSAKEKEKKNR